MAKTKKSSKVSRWVLLITFWTFFLSVILSLVSQLLLNRIAFIGLAFALLMAVILLGIVFDMIGTAAMAANKASLNAKASRKVDGARRGVYLLQHADQVANFCNDVVGDISSIASGTMGALIVVRLVSRWQGFQDEVYISILLTAVVSAITVGGKARGKTFAIRKSTEIILFAGKVIAWFDKLVLLLTPWARERRR